jgi:hypothetical protein
MTTLYLTEHRTKDQDEEVSTYIRIHLKHAAIGYSIEYGVAGHYYLMHGMKMIAAGNSKTIAKKYKEMVATNNT